MRLLLALAVAVAFAATPAVAQIWNEVGDAGDLPATAQVPVGNGPLIQINGTLLPNDADMYCIKIPDPTAFSATTCGGTTADTQLWLFDPQGIGMSFNDDDPGGCGLQSTVTGNFIPAPGNYYIAVSQYDWDPHNPSILDIWLDTPYNVERAPDGPGAPGPVAGWSGNTYSDGPYSIFLAGAVYCGSTAVEPTSWGMIKSLYR